MFGQSLDTSNCWDNWLINSKEDPSPQKNYNKNKKQNKNKATDKLKQSL